MGCSRKIISMKHCNNCDGNHPSSDLDDESLEDSDDEFMRRLKNVENSVNRMVHESDFMKNLYIYKEEIKKSNGNKGRVICLDNEPTFAFLKCGHLCLCSSCKKKWHEDELKCPICRCVSKRIIRIFI